MGTYRKSNRPVALRHDSCDGNQQRTMLLDHAPHMCGLQNRWEFKGRHGRHGYAPWGGHTSTWHIRALRHVVCIWSSRGVRILIAHTWPCSCTRNVDNWRPGIWTHSRGIVEVWNSIVAIALSVGSNFLHHEISIIFFPTAFLSSLFSFHCKWIDSQVFWITKEWFHLGRTSSFEFWETGEGFVSKDIQQWQLDYESLPLGYGLHSWMYSRTLILGDSLLKLEYKEHVLTQA